MTPWAPGTLGHHLHSPRISLDVKYLEDFDLWNFRAKLHLQIVYH